MTKFVDTIDSQDIPLVHALVTAGKSSFAEIARHYDVDGSTVSKFYKRTIPYTKNSATGEFILTQDKVVEDFLTSNGNVKIVIDPSVTKSKLTISHTGGFVFDFVIDPGDTYSDVVDEFSLSDDDIFLIDDVATATLIVGEFDNKGGNISPNIEIIEKSLVATPEEAIANYPAKVEVAEDEEIIWTASSKFISLTKGDVTINADADHKMFKEALQALFDGDLQKAFELISIKEGLKKFVKGDIRIEGVNLFYKDVTLKSGLTERIIEKYKSGESIDSLLAFLEKVMENPTRKTVYRLFDFLQANDIEITDDGHFTAWKVVRSTYKDKHSNTMDNSPGKTVEMERFSVEDNDNITCSSGLHVCSKSYIRHFSGGSDRVVKVKVHPKDVVSIPTDYNDAKMRTCKYVVLTDVTDSFLKEIGR